MFCEKCGTQLRSGEKFCPKCGTPAGTVSKNRPETEEDVTMAYREQGSQRGYEDEDVTMAYRDQVSQGGCGDEDVTMAYRDQGSQRGYGDEDVTMAYRDQRGQRGYGDGDVTVTYREGHDGPYYDPYGDPGYGNGGQRGGGTSRPPQKNNKPWLYAILGLAAVLLVVFIAIEAKTILSLDDDTEEETVAEADSQEEQDDLSEETAVAEEATPLPTVTPMPTPVEAPAVQSSSGSSGGYLDNDYIFPDSSYRELTEADFADKTEWELKVARNEIYARHGRMFDTPALDSHFRSKSWYVPSIPAAQFDDQNILSTLELRNATLILNYELAHGMET